MERCINCKKEIIAFGETQLDGFSSAFPPPAYKETVTLFLFSAHPQYEELRGVFYPFVRESEQGSFQHLHIERCFADGHILLRLTNIYVSYLKYEWDIAQCTQKISLTNSSYSRLQRIPADCLTASPWVSAENSKQGLQAGLAALKEWYAAHQAEIDVSYEKQQRLLDKDRSYQIVRGYLKTHFPLLTEEDIFGFYRQIDQLADQYHQLPRENFGKPLSFFENFCSDKLLPPFDSWIDELSEQMSAKKHGVTDDPAYARAFSTLGLLYFFHDCAKERWPEILASRKNLFAQEF